MPGKLLQKSSVDDRHHDDGKPVPDSDAILALKATREFEYNKKLTLKSARKKRKGMSSHNETYIRAAPKGGCKIRLDGGDDEEVIETDWVAAVDSRPDSSEVLLANLLKPGKARRQPQRGMFSPCHTAQRKVLIGSRTAGDFEVIPNMRSVIILEEHSASEPEVEEPWEELDFEDDDQGVAISHHALSYAEVAASTT